MEIQEIIFGILTIVILFSYFNIQSKYNRIKLFRKELIRLCAPYFEKGNNLIDKIEILKEEEKAESDADQRTSINIIIRRLTIESKQIESKTDEIYEYLLRKYNLTEKDIK